MVILGLQLQTEPKSADDIIGAYFSGLLCFMIWMLCKSYKHKKLNDTDNLFDSYICEMIDKGN